MYSIFRFLICLCCLFLLPVSGHSADAVSASKPEGDKPETASHLHDEYLKYFEEVYKVMDEHYFFELQRSDYERFIREFEGKIYPSLLMEKKSNDYVRWRSAAYLVDFLKQPDDLFSRFLPPKPAEKFAKEVYGQKIDLGITGHMIEAGFSVDFIEPRSDAYEKGLRENDLIVRMDGEPLAGWGEEKVKDKLNPLAGSRVGIDFFDAIQHKPHEIEVESREYFKQTVFQKPTGVRDVYCLEIPKFNQGTPEDMTRFLAMLAPKNPRGLVLDLRGNPGGPPLAARAISGFFLPNGESLVYFEGRHRPRADLDIPVLPPAFRFDWPLVILVDSGTGSASELFSGVMQDRKRAVVMGDKTAGQVLLKSMFDMSDGSSMALVTARGHFPDGRPFPFDGVRPDENIPAEKKDQLVTMAAQYIYVKSLGKI
ncbi:MAG: PDZ domain-containing protein [Candidatus Omnitrophica bacterium]|nr:PDZ domain-containing protein [Candidatus Omnitrophota bacterium]